MRKFLISSAALLLLTFATAHAAAVPVGDFFKDPEFTNVSLSPTGEYITVSVPQADRTVLAAFRVADMKLVGKWDYGKDKHIERVRWLNHERFFLFVSKKVGRFDFRVGTPDVYATNVDGKKRRDIPNGGFYSIVDTLDDDPEEILVGRSIDSAFLSKMNIYDGRIRNYATAPIRFGTFLVDHEANVRYAMGTEEDNTSVVLRRDGDSWTTISRTEMGGPTRFPLMFDRENKNVLFAISNTGEPSHVSLVDPETGTEKKLSSNPNVDPDLGGALVSSDGRELLAVAYEDGILGYDFINTTHPESKAYAGLINAFPGQAVRFSGISKDGRYILLRVYSDVDPGGYYLFDREKVQAKFLLASMNWIKPAQMSTMKPISLAARDGVKLHGYITIPNGSDGKNLPMILHPHGGPHGPRDEWGFNPEVQFLASRGYAVLQINFRGSGGYGNTFESSGYRNWGTTMIDDMTDAVDWAIGQGIADPQRMCTYGASYGGYAALQSVVRNPEKYRCTVGYVGVYSIPLMFRDGDIPETEPGQNFLKRVHPQLLADQQAQSPAYNTDKIRIPVMLVHGAKDRRVPMSQYRLLKKNLEDAGNPPEVTVVEDKEGHGFYDYDNQVELYTAMQAFFDKHLGIKPAVASNASN